MNPLPFASCPLPMTKEQCPKTSEEANHAMRMGDCPEINAQADTPQRKQNVSRSHYHPNHQPSKHMKYHDQSRDTGKYGSLSHLNLRAA